MHGIQNVQREETPVSAFEDYGAPLETKRVLLDCLFGGAAALVGLLVQWLVWPFIQPSPFLFMTVVIVVVGRHGGWAPGLSALLVACIGISLMFLDPVGAFAVTPRDLLTIGVFAVLGVLVTALNAARLRSLRAVENRGRWFQTTLASIGDAVIATDRDGRVVYMNGVTETLTGWRMREALGRPLAEVFHIVNEETREVVESPVDRVIREGKVVGLANHTALIDRAGREYIIEDSGAPIRDERGELIGVVLVFRDSTPRWRAQQRKNLLAEATASLASSLDYDVTLANVVNLAVPRFADWCAVHLADGDGPHQVAAAGNSEARESVVVAPLTAREHTLGTITFARNGRAYDEADITLANELAQRMALAVDNARLYAETQAAVRARDEFLQIASHELKTPLTPLQIQLETMQRALEKAGVANAQITAKLDSATRQTTRLSRLVESLLDVSRITSGRITLEPEPVELAALVSEIADRFSAEAERFGTEIRVTSDEVTGSWDRLRLEQIITNLIANAMKYGPGKPIEVGVHGRDGTAQITVTDHGIGIDAAALERIFGRFERAVSSRHFGGLGLGLFIARQFVEAHGGTIVASSEPGAGSTFTVELPLVAEGIAS